MRPDRLFGRSFYYGWVVVVAAFILMAVGFGVAYSFGTYFEPLGQEFGADRSSVAFVFALTGLLYFGLGAITGPLTDRFGPRLLCGIAALIYLAGLFLASQATEIWQVYVTYSIFVGIGVAATYVPSVSTVQRWFLRRRALASGLAVSGIGVGTVLGPAASTWLIVTSGWRTAYLITGLVAAALTLLAALFLLRSPAQIGLAPDGDPVGPTPQPVRGRLSPSDRTVGEAVRTREFLGLYLAIVFTCLPVFLAFAHIVPYARDAGLDLATASIFGLGALGVGSAVGRLILGSFADRFGRRQSYALTIAMITLLMLIWLGLPAAEVWALGIFCFLFGTAYGGFVSLCPAMMADYFGTSYVSGTIGVFYTGAGVGAFLGPWLAGAVYDRTGSYYPAILAGFVTALIATIVVLRLRDAAQVRAQFAAAQAQAAPAGQPAQTVPTTPATQAIRRGEDMQPADESQPQIPPEPAPDWPTWLAARRQEEADLARGFELWSHQTRDGDLAEVLEIAAARARDRAFLLRRAGAADPSAEQPRPGAVVASRWPDSGSDLDRLGQLPPLLSRYAGGVAEAPDERGQELVQHLQTSERETLELIEEQRQRLLAISQREAVRLLPGRPAEQLGGGRVYWKQLSSDEPGSPTIIRVAQRPDSLVRLAPGGGPRIVMGLDGSGLIRLADSAPEEAAESIQPGQAIEIGAEATVEVSVADDLLLSFLLIATGPLAPATVYPTGAEDAAGLPASEATVLVQAAPNGAEQADLPVRPAGG